MEEFKTQQKEKKARLNVTIDKSLMEMITDIMVDHKVPISTATNDILKFFKTEFYDNNLVEKAGEKQEEEVQDNTQ